MPTPDFRKHGYEPELDSRNHFSYVNRSYSYGLPYRIGAVPDGQGGWTVYVHWDKSKEPHEGGTTYSRIEGDLHNYTQNQSQRDKRFDAAMAIERAMREYSQESYGPGRVPDSSDEGTVDSEFDFTGGSF